MFKREWISFSNNDYYSTLNSGHNREDFMYPIKELATVHFEYP